MRRWEAMLLHTRIISAKVTATLEGEHKLESTKRPVMKIELGIEYQKLSEVEVIIDNCSTNDYF